MNVERPNLSEALLELRRELERPLVKFLDWLSRYLPHWIGTLPDTPRWIGPMFWIHLAVWPVVLVVLAATIL